MAGRRTTSRRRYRACTIAGAAAAATAAVSCLVSNVCPVSAFVPSQSTKHVDARLIKLRASASSKPNDDNENNNNNNNPFVTVWSSLAQASPSRRPAVETEEQRIKRLKDERLAELSEGEIRRAERVREDAVPYLALLALQMLPLLGTERIYSVTYFFGLAVATVYLGGRQETIDPPERVTKQNALAAPIGASVSIGLIYSLIKLGLDPTSLYALAVTLFGALAISDVGVPILRNVLPQSFAETEVAVPKRVADRLELYPPSLPLDGLTTLALGLAATVIYWSPIALESKFLVSNALAWALAMASLASISLGSFQTGAILLAGLFAYDIFFVFGSDVMMTVATKVEAPVKFLYTAPPSDTPRDYPFSVLGLGDVVVPGIFVRFMSRIDEVLVPTYSYFTATTAAYAAGLAICFTVNEITGAGQPALLYLDPACVGTALAVGAANGQLQEVWSFGEGDDDSPDEQI